jgi:rRNA maturation endonuclease Nob1
MISKLFFAYRAPNRHLFLLHYELFCLFYMAAAAEHAVNAPFIAWLILVAPKLFTAYYAMNDLLFAEDVQVKYYMPQRIQKCIYYLFASIACFGNFSYKQEIFCNIIVDIVYKEKRMKKAKIF